MLFCRAMTKKGLQVGFVALGCPKNIVDSEKMLAEIVQAGYLIAQDPDSADCVVINTCGFIEPAKMEAVEAIRQAVRQKNKGRVRKVIVVGCLAERLGEKLFEEAGGIDAIAGLGERDNIAAIIKKTLESEEKGSYFGHALNGASDDRGRMLITGGHSAYLRISEGCDHRCAFCTIPAIRGRFGSKPVENVLAEAEELASSGVVELNVIAQDTAYYGRDMGMKEGLANLSKELEKIKGLKWIRLMYLYPVGISEQLIETVAASKKILRYFDIPIQHINNTILKNMRRPDTKEKITALIERLRAAMPDVVLRTTVIVGLPGETEENFQELIEFIEWARFDALGCFKYWRESGTAAAEMDNQVEEALKRQRVERLMLTQQRIAFAKNRSRMGQRLQCIVESVDGKGGGSGRFYGQAPEIDSVCLIKKCRAGAGDFIDTRVIAAQDYDLIVEQV